MKTIVNTAYAEFYTNNTPHCAISNNCNIYLFTPDCLFQGEVLCSGCTHRWKLTLVDCKTNKNAFTISGRKNRSFCFAADTSCNYHLFFTAPSCCTLRLYNTPECITDIMYSNKI